MGLGAVRRANCGGGAAAVAGVVWVQALCAHGQGVALHVDTFLSSSERAVLASSCGWRRVTLIHD